MLHHEMVINFSTHFEVAQASHFNLQSLIKTAKPVYAQESLTMPPHYSLINNKKAWVSGLQTNPIQTVTGGKHFTVGVLFKPWGLQSLTGIDAFELQNNSVELETIFGVEATSFVEEIYAQPDADSIFAILEHFLLKKLTGRKVPSFLWESMTCMQKAALEDGIVNKIAAQLSISPKTFIQTFKKYIGLTPGKFHHLLVLNQTLHYLTKHPGQELTISSYALSFFDQAHFIHFFRKYTGITPSEYIRQYKAGKVQTAIPHTIEMTLS